MFFYRLLFSPLLSMDATGSDECFNGTSGDESSEADSNSLHAHGQRVSLGSLCMSSPQRKDSTFRPGHDDTCGVAERQWTPWLANRTERCREELPFLGSTWFSSWQRTERLDLAPQHSQSNTCCGTSQPRSAHQVPEITKKDIRPIERFSKHFRKGRL